MVLARPIMWLAEFFLGQQRVCVSLWLSTAACCRSSQTLGQQCSWLRNTIGQQVILVCIGQPEKILLWRDGSPANNNVVDGSSWPQNHCVGTVLLHDSFVGRAILSANQVVGQVDCLVTELTDTIKQARGTIWMI